MLAKGVSTILLDIEGTLCPIWFVSKVLYPYATEHLKQTVTDQWNHEEFAPYRAAFPEEIQDSPDAVINHCLQLASKDIKDPAWKKLQGLIWRQGYADGVLSVPLFSDVAPTLKRWHGEKYTLAIFSSGSVQAQKLFFAYVDPEADLSNEQSQDFQRKSGGVKTEDLNSLFKTNFDTINAGSKIHESSYKKIMEELRTLPERCLFLSDNVKEIAAAKEAGLQAAIVDRPGNAPLSEQDKQEHVVITSLEQVHLESSS